MPRVREIDLNTPEYYDRIWAEEVRSGRGRYDKVRMRALCKHVKPEDVVADVGCGLWGPLEWLMVDHPERTPARPIFCDYSEYVRVMLEMMFPLAEFADSIEALPPADVVISGEVIEHMQDPAAFAAHLASRARRVVALSTLDHECEQAQVMDYPEHLWQFTAGELMGVLTPVCERVNYELVGNYHVAWGFV
jgi:hypothetical protein